MQFREIARPTFLRGGLGDLPSRGLYWIEEESGRVVKTELDFRQDYTVDSNRIRRELRYVETIPEEEGLRRTIEWERLNPPGSTYPEPDYAAEDAVLVALDRGSR